MDKFETKFTLLDVLVPKRRRIARNEEIKLFSRIGHRSNDTVAYYAKRSWPTYAFKIKLTQELKPLDHLKRRNFSNWALAKLERNEEFHRKSSSAMKLISGSMALLIRKICVVGQQQTKMCFTYFVSECPSSASVVFQLAS